MLIFSNFKSLDKDLNLYLTCFLRSITQQFEFDFLGLQASRVDLLTQYYVQR